MYLAVAPLWARRSLSPEKPSAPRLQDAPLRAPCNITSTVGPFSFGTNNATVAASSAGIQSTYSSTTNAPVYLSGGTISGSQGQTCDLSSFNGVIGATATVALTGKNAIANGTQLTIVTPGFGATVAPTSAILSNGTATCSGTATVQTALTSGVMTAQAPGATSLFASVSGVNSVGAPYNTCAVASILVHSSSGSGTSFSLTPPNTQGLVADVLDSAGQSITPTLNWASSSNVTATVAATGTSNGATATAVGPGTAYITASCATPTCNINVSTQYSQNAPASTCLRTMSRPFMWQPNSKSLVPVSTADNSVGAAIALPVLSQFHRRRSCRHRRLSRFGDGNHGGTDGLDLGRDLPCQRDHSCDFARRSVLVALRQHKQRYSLLQYQRRCRCEFHERHCDLIGLHARQQVQRVGERYSTWYRVFRQGRLPPLNSHLFLSESV